MRLGAASVGFLVGFTAPRADAATIEYTVTDLGTFGGPSQQSYASCISNNGQIGGYSTDPVYGLAANAFYCAGNGAAMQDIGTLDGNPLSVSSVQGINNNGWAVGSSDSGSQTFGFLWTPSGGMQVLNFGGTGSTAYGINAAGVVVGGYLTANGASHGFEYSNGVMTDTGTLIPVAINATGQMASFT